MVVKSWKSEDVGCQIDIDHDLCDGDGECQDSCPTECFEIVDKKATVPNIDECIECCACQEACPTGALKHTSC